MLIKKVLAGEIAYEKGIQTVQRAQALFTAVLEQLPPDYSFPRLQRELNQEWDSGRGIFGSVEMRRENVEFLLTIAKLMRYMQRHFGKPKEGKM